MQELNMMEVEEVGGGFIWFIVIGVALLLASGEAR